MLSFPSLIHFEPRILITAFLCGGRSRGEGGWSRWRDRDQGRATCGMLPYSARRLNLLGTSPPRLRRRALSHLTAASRRPPATLIAVIVDLDHRHRFTDDEPVSRQRDLILNHLTKGRELLVLPVCVNDDLIDQLLQCGGIFVVVAPFRFIGLFSPCRVFLQAS